MRLPLVLTVAAVIVVGCGQESSSIPSDPSAIATYDSGSVTIDQLAQHVGTLSESERILPHDPTARAEWMEGAVADMLYEAHLVELAGTDKSAELDLTAPDHAAILADLLVRWAASSPHSVSAVPELGGASGLQRRRLVYHFFRRVTDSGAKAQYTAELRQRSDSLASLDDFIGLVRAESDSESAEEDGLLGWVSEGGQSTPLKETIFGLPVREISEPITTRDGIHMFYVADEVEPVPAVGDGVDTTSYAAQYARLAHYRDTREEENAAFEQVSHPEETSVDGILIRGADWSIDTWLLNAWREKVDVASRVDVKVVLQDLAWLMQRAHETPDFVSNVNERIATQRAEAYFRKIALQRIARDETAVRDYYSRFLRRYSEAPEWRLRILRLPVGDEYPATLAVLEDAYEQGQSIEDLCKTLGVEIPAEVTLSLEQLAGISPQFAYQVSSSNQGAVGRPRIVAGQFVIGEVVSRPPPEPLPFEQVRSRVAIDMFNANGRELYQQMRDAYAESIELKVHPENMGNSS